MLRFFFVNCSCSSALPIAMLPFKIVVVILTKKSLILTHFGEYENIRIMWYSNSIVMYILLRRPIVISYDRAPTAAEQIQKRSLWLL